MNPHTCPVCRGMKQIQNPYTSGHTAAPLVISCPTCHGTGIVWEPDDYAEANMLRVLGLKAKPPEPRAPSADVNEIFEHFADLFGNFFEQYYAKDKSQVPTEPKTLDVTSSKDFPEKVSDVVVFGDPDLWRLVCKASSKSQGWMKSTKAMALPSGVLIQVSTQQGEHVAEALAFVPCVYQEQTMAALGVGPEPPEPPTGDPREEADKMREEADEGEILAAGEDPHLGTLAGDVFGLGKP